MSESISKKFFLTICIVFITIIFMLTVIGVYLNIVEYKYTNKVYPNTYLGKDTISGYNYEELVKKLNSTELNNNITIMYNDKKIEARYKDLGIKIDAEKTIETINKHYENMPINDKMFILLDAKKDYVDYEYKIDEDAFKEFLNKIKNEYDSDEVKEKFERDDDRNIKYVAGTGSHYLDIDKTIEQFKKNGLNSTNIIKLVVDNSTVNNHKEYALIDTKVSSFMTEFNPYISRATNLRTALNYIDGAIIEPGEEFSFYKYAGPFGKKGYVFYYEFVGNGVCQIATTAYNAALLGGLEITRRYQHEYIAPYVPGGLDATVASYSSGYYVDMSFKNTYKYPIYISAYYNGGEAHVDIWSNSNAKEGKTYKTESVKIGPTSYATYLHIYKDGEEIEKKKIANSWYKVKED